MVQHTAYALFCLINAFIANNVFAYRIEGRSIPASYAESSNFDSYNTKPNTDSKQRSVLHECMMEECQSLPLSRRTHCNEACLRYSNGFDKFIKRSGSINRIQDENEYGNARSQYGDPIGQDAIIGYEEGSLYNGKKLRPVFSRQDSTDVFSNFIGGGEPEVNNENDSEYGEIDLCRKFCEKHQSITSFETCFEVVCAKQIKLNNNIKNAKRNFSSNKREIGKTIQKRWPSRLSCLEMKCGRFAGNQQNFYDCGVRMCTD